MNKPLLQLVSHSQQNNMEDVVYRSSVGVSGFFATTGLQNINLFLSILVGAATLVFMILSIIKVLKELRDGR